jgi:hypothetical protein
LIPAGSLGWALAVAVAVGLVARSRIGGGRARPWLALGLMAVAVGATVPLPGGLPLVAYLRGIGGEPSVSSLVLLAALALALVGGPDVVDRRELLPLFAASASGATFLYPMALGLTRFDPYAQGYPPRARLVLVALALLALAAALTGRVLVLVSVLAAVACWSFALFESTNLWDYLLDPWLSLASALWLLWYLRSSAGSPNLRKPDDPPR